MIIRDIYLTLALARWLRDQHDDGAPPLRSVQRSEDVEVTRADGTELTDSEAAHVRGVVAAHRVEPLK